VLAEHFAGASNSPTQFWMHALKDLEQELRRRSLGALGAPTDAARSR
jgi:hypothetical protein